jgi:hypothetical protein
VPVEGSDEAVSVFVVVDVLERKAAELGVWPFVVGLGCSKDLDVALNIRHLRRARREKLQEN